MKERYADNGQNNSAIYNKYAYCTIKISYLEHYADVSVYGKHIQGVVFEHVFILNRLEFCLVTVFHVLIN